MSKYVLCLAACICLFGCKKDNEKKLEGEIGFLTYNIAGLPTGISGSHPLHNTPFIAALLNDYDVVNVQEDFNYNHLLYKGVTHPYRTPWLGPVPVGDGLNTLSIFPIHDFKRIKWNTCFGTDCMTPKGFTFSRIQIAKGFFVDLYNVHANAQSDSLSMAARRKNISQLAEYIKTHSAGRAVILMGDTNCRYSRIADNIREILALGLKDAWLEYRRNGEPPAQNDDSQRDCDPDPGGAGCEVVDKIFYRSNDKISFEVAYYTIEEQKFKRNGEDLSDHWPVYVRLKYATN